MDVKIIWGPLAWEHLDYWMEQDRKTLNKIRRLIRETCRAPFEGIGEPERLKGNWSGYLSRRIDEKNRLVYRVLDNGDIEIAKCKGHYNDK